MLRLYTFILLTFLSISLFAQKKFLPSPEYKKQAQKAYSLYKNKKYLQSGLSYDTLLSNRKRLRGDEYNAACSWALAGNADKAFNYLTLAVFKDKWDNLSHISTDKDLDTLHSDKRWISILEQVRKNEIVVNKKLIKPLKEQLDSIRNDDQFDRRKIDTIQKQYGWKSKQIDSLWKRINYFDSINLIKVTSILDNYGWLGEEEISKKGAITLFLVIQHADSSTQIKYLPMMRKAVKKGKAYPQDLALLEDRILTNQGKPQIYGSQVTTNDKTGKQEFFPIYDEINVNKRRLKVGLDSLEEYAKFFKIDYTLPKK